MKICKSYIPATLFFSALMFLLTMLAANVNAEESSHQIVIPYVPEVSTTYAVELKDFCDEVKARNGGTQPQNLGVSLQQNPCVFFETGFPANFASFQDVLSKFHEEGGPAVFKKALQEWKKPKSTIRAQNGFEILSVISGAAVSPMSSQSTTSSKSLGSLEERIIDGLTEFVATRAKAEAARYLRKKLKNDLCEKEDGKLYIPRLCQALDSADYSLFGTTSYLRAAIRADLEQLPDAVLFKMTSSNGKLITYRIALAAYRETRLGRDALDVIRGISGLRDEICSGIKGVGNNKDLCLNASQKLVHAAQQFRALAETLPSDKTKITAELYPYIAVSTYFRLRKICTNNSLATDLCQQNSEQVAADIRRILALIENALGTMRAIESATQQARLDVKQEASTNEEKIKQRIMALEYALTLLIDTCATEECKAIKQIFRFGTAIIENDRPRIGVEGLMFIQQHSAQLPDEIKKFIPVMTEIANAQSSDEVVAIIEAVALPVGGYEQKAKRDMTTLTAFVGVTGGLEYSQFSNHTFSGVASPIGVHLSTQCESYLCKNGSRGLYLSFLDLGPVLANRSGEQGVEQTDKLGFSQLLSPGVFGTWSFWDSPFIMGFGMSSTPKILRTSSGAETSATRLQLFFAIDVTIMSL